MADPAPVGSDVQAGTYRCTNFGHELGVQSVQSLPPCPECEGPCGWAAVTGGDSAMDPYPDRNRSKGPTTRGWRCWIASPWSHS
jgi:hypothetical protein